MKHAYSLKTRQLSFLLCLLFLLSAFTGCVRKIPAPVEQTEVTTVTETVSQEPEKYIRFTLNDPPDVSQHTELQWQYLNGSYSSAAKYADGTKERSAPEPILLSWSVEVLGYAKPSRYQLTVGKNADLSDGITYTTSNTSKKLNNFEIGTRYYWQVSTTVSGETLTSDVASFVTGSKGPRTLSVPGVANVRDLGGYVGLDGATLRQGLLYRCGRLNDNGKTTVSIQEAGIRVMLDTMHVRTEIDLRRDSEHGVDSSPLGDTVQYFLCPMEYSFPDSRNILTGNTAEIKRVFHLLADESNYPVFYHCSIGTDRTGMISFLVLALLGVDQETIYRDYLFSNFANIGGTRSASTIRNYITTVSLCPGSTLAERTYNYLLKIGVPASELDTIRAMMLEK